jgi:hypothetical protein
MHQSNRAVLTIIGAVLLISLACTCGALSSAATPTPDEGVPVFPTDDENGDVPTEESLEATTEAPTEESTDGGNFDTEFPIPDDAQNFADVGGTVNFQTGMSLDDALAFYRDAFAGQGYTERSLLTSTTDTTFSIVFDGHPSGEAIVVQAVDLGTNTTNVSIRLEDV